jgi:hypothetical protein
VNDIEDDYSDYLDAREREGGPQPGRSDVAGWLVISAVAALGVLVLGLLLLA